MARSNGSHANRLLPVRARTEPIEPCLILRASDGFLPGREQSRIFLKKQNPRSTVSRGLCGQRAEGTGRHLEAERGHRSGANAQEHTRDGVATRNPELANHVRESLAILREGPSDFVARVNSWFDQTIDRLSEVSRSIRTG